MSVTVEDHYRLLVQSVVDYAIYMLSPEGIVTSWNRGAESIKGFTESEIIGQHFSVFYTPEDRAAGMPEHVLETAARVGRYEAEAWRIKKDGSRFWANVVVDAIRNEAGNLVGFAKVTRDMTEKRQAQDALLESERRFRILVEGVTDYAIYMLDPNGCVTNWNAGAERIKQYAFSEIVGEHFSRFYTPEERDAEVPARALRTARETGRYEAEGWRMRKDGSRFWASVVIDAIRDEKGELVGFAKITRDMTEKRQNQIRLDESREQLFRSQKMEALGQLTGGLAHDFNNLLTAILGSADLALRQGDDLPKLRRMLESIRASAQRGAGLTKQLLAFARAQPLQIKTVDMRDFLSELVTLLRPSVRSDIELITETSDRLWPVDADPGALELALLNLAFNARDAMKDGGKLRVSAWNVTLDGTPDGLSGDFVALRIADTGEGIAPDVLDRVFEPFFTTKKFGEGTGLGLSQVFGFAKQLRGTVTVESEVGEGTTFTLYLPASKSLPHDDSALSRDGKRGTILVVEDDAIVAELAGSILDELGFGCIIVHSGTDALDRMDGEPIQAVFTDIIMPGGISGLELAAKVRDRFPEMPILLTTGYSEKATGNHGFPILPKPYDLKGLATALSELLQTDIANLPE